MAYSEKVIDHYKNPRNVGSLPKDDPNVGTGLVGAPECGDVMKLQMKITRKPCLRCDSTGKVSGKLSEEALHDFSEKPCPDCKGVGWTEIVEDAKFKTFGCGSAIASSSLATEWVKGKTVGEVLKIKNTEIVKELNLPPVKIHCSVLAEDAIKAAISDWRKKQAANNQNDGGKG